MYSYSPLRSATDMAHCESVIQSSVAHFYTGLASTAHCQIVCRNETLKISSAFLKEVVAGETLVFTLIQRWNCISLFVKPQSVTLFLRYPFQITLSLSLCCCCCGGGGGGGGGVCVCGAAEGWGGGQAGVSACVRVCVCDSVCVCVCVCVCV